MPDNSQRTTSTLMASSKANNFSTESTSLYVARNIVGLNGTHYENGLFSSSFSEIFDKKLRLFSDNSKFGEDEPFVPSKEIEAQTIGDLLPDDDDLLSDAINDTGYGARVRGTDDTDDDIFCSGGGIELEADDNFIHNRTLGYVGGEIEAPNVKQWDLNSQFSGEHSNCGHPARTLFVRNIVSNVEDSELRALFEQFGDIQTLNTSCKHRGFVMISYFDIRAACNALRSLQNKPLRHRKLDIHFSIAMENSSEKDTNQGALAVFNIDSSVSNDDIRKKFGIYGEIKEICENPHKHPHKIIEFYDIRATEAALRALNRNDIAGDKTKTDRSQPGAARWCFMQQLPPELEQEEPRGHRQGILTYNSPSGYYGSIENDLIKSNGFDKGAVQGLHSFSVPRNLASTVRVASAGNQINHGELSQSLGQMKVDFQHMPAFHPHSVPEYHDNIVNGMPYNSTSTIPSMAINPDGFRHIHKLGSGHLNKHSENNEAGFGGPSNGSFPLNDHQYIWSTGNAYHRQSPGPMIWPKSPAFMNSIPARPLLQMHGLPGASPHMLNPVLPLPNHHVGSAPVMNPSLWDNQQDLSALHPFSMGNMRVSCNSPMHPVEFASHGGIFPRSGANCIDPAHGTIPSSRERSYTFRGRNTEVSPSFDAPNDRLRSRRSVASASQLDVKGQYELDIGRIIRGDDSRTTLMIKNIPNKYTSKMLLATIDEHNRGTYDFIYLPIDFKNKCNVGYAFINMIHPQHIVPFHQAFNGKKWEKFNSEKVASLAYARIQGKTALIAHFQNSSLMNEDKRCRPILFHSDGPNAGDQEPFPVGDNIRTRPSRSRTAGNEENHQDSPLTSPKGEDNFIWNRLPTQQDF